MSSIFRALGFFAALLAAGCLAPSKQESALQRFEYEQPQMGVPFRIVLYASSEAAAEDAAKAAFKRVEELNAIMSDYETDSELSRLSRTSEEGAPDVKISPDLWGVLSLSTQLARETGGAFDVTVGPYVALWRKARRDGQMPDPARLRSARAKVGYTNLVLNPETRTARLLARGMRLDLGGIAKGFAADEALKVLRGKGINRALVAASGDLAVGDPPPGEPGWKVEIAGYDREDGPKGFVVYASNRGVSTSGDVFQKVEISGVRYSHIVDPFTGIGMTNHALATVIAPTCALSDALATICTIIQPTNALTLVDQYRAAARIIQVRGPRSAVFANRRFATETRSR